MAMTSASPEVAGQRHWDWLPGLEPDEVKWITSLATVTQRSRGDVIYMADDMASRVYWVKQGRVSLTSSTEDGREFLIRMVGAGGIFGEVAVMLGTPHAEFATAVEPTTLYEIGRRDFEEVLRRSRCLALHICRGVGLKLRRIESRLVNLLYKNVELRVRKALADLIDWTPTTRTASEATLSVTHQHVANLIGASRQETSRALKRLESEGLIELGYGTIVVKAADELVAMRL